MGNPCYKGPEDASNVPGGAYVCNSTISICLEKWEGPNYGITSFDNIGLAMLTVFQVSGIVVKTVGILVIVTCDYD